VGGGGGEGHGSGGGAVVPPRRRVMPEEVTEANWPVLAGMLGARLLPFEWPVVSPAARALAAPQAGGTDSSGWGVRALAEAMDALAPAAAGAKEGAAEGEAEGAVEGAAEGAVEGAAEGAVEGAVEGAAEGEVAGEAAGATPGAAPSMDEEEAKALVGRTVEIYWDGELRWFAAEVVGYDEAARTHTVLYVEDGVQSDEALLDGAWRSATPAAVAAARSVARAAVAAEAKAKTAAAAAARAAATATAAAAAAAYAALPVEAKLGLLAALVGAASESELTARAADTAHATWSTMQAEAEARHGRREREATRAGVELDLERQLASRKRKLGEPSDETRYAASGEWLATRHGLGGPATRLTRAELEAAELELLLETVEQATATDGQGKQRQFRTVAHAEARRKALERRRDAQRSARVVAEAALRRLVDDYAAGSAGVEEASVALALGRAACLEGDTTADGLGPLGCATGRWLLHEMSEAYVCLGAAWHDERTALERGSAHAALAGRCVRSISLGCDRRGRCYWALSTSSEAPTEPVVWIEPSPPPLPPPRKLGGGAGADASDVWHRCVGLEGVEALAESLDARGVRERALQAALWRLCDGALRAAYDEAAVGAFETTEEALPPFVPEPNPVAQLGSGQHEHAESFRGGMSASEVDARMYHGAYDVGWRVFARDGKSGHDGHFWCRPQKHTQYCAHRTLRRRGSQSHMRMGMHVHARTRARAHARTGTGSRTTASAAAPTRSLSPSPASPHASRTALLAARTARSRRAPRAAPRGAPLSPNSHSRRRTPRSTRSEHEHPLVACCHLAAVIAAALHTVHTRAADTVTRYLPKNPGSPLFMRDLGGQAGRGAPNQISTST
jgi:hypothetical protein